MFARPRLGSMYDAKNFHRFVAFVDAVNRKIRNVCENEFP